MSKILNRVFSMQIGLILLLVFALSCAVATFVENDFGTQSAFALIYASWWFSAIQVWLGLLVFYNLFRFNLFRREKFPSLIFHLSFIFILFGAGLTRYYGFEGMVHIREGESQNLVSSTTPYVQLKALKNGKLYSESKPKLFSFVGGNSFSISLDIDGKKANFEYENIIPNATKELVEDKASKPIISLMISSNKTKPFELILKEGELKKDRHFEIGFGKDELNSSKLVDFQVSLEDGKFYFLSSKKVSWYKMSDSSKGEYEAGKKTPFLKKQLYTIEGMNIVPKALLEHGKESWVKSEENKKGLTAIVGKLSYDGKSKEVALLSAGSGSEGIKESVEIANQIFSLQWGSKMYELPFSLELIDFQLERYAGSMSPSSYASEVKVIDKKNGVNMPFRIYMNHVLDYQGFRFFQSSYDRDEKGTILSVNQDPGKWPTYLGYFLLSLGLFLNILNPKSRFRKLASDINKTSLVKGACIVAFASLTPLHANTLLAYNKNHANLFGTILIQSADGRIKPIDTLSHEVLSKVSRTSNIDGQNPNQVLLGMVTNPKYWQEVPMIKVYDPMIKKILGMKENAKYASFDQFFETSGDKKYKLIKQIEETKRKKPSQRDKFDKDLIKVDERLNICYLVYTGELLKMFPLIGDKEKRWFAPNAAITYFPANQSEQIQPILSGYFQSIADSVEAEQKWNWNTSKGDKESIWNKANSAVEVIKSYQKQYANAIIPSQSRISTEIYFNHLQIFYKLFPVYLILGFVLLFAIFFKMIFTSINLKTVSKFILIATSIAFFAHTIGLGMRWYISGHAPWSDGYESMVYIAWALALSGILFSKKSPISLALTSVLAGISLFVAHLSWMDPQITNLVPVLKSYWLTIHVSIITASYGFLGLCSLLGFFTLILFLLRNPKRDDKRNKEIDKNIKEATKINEMAMILGLSLLTIGNFLGGVWANESWGRYWGWDAKETWALISILVYATVVHIRFIPKLNNQYAFAVASTFAYWSILMTYFGVNFYLSGMHSYASGDPVPIPTFVPVTALVMLVISILAYFKRGVAAKL